MDIATALNADKSTVVLQCYDARGCANVASESIKATIAAIQAMESRFSRRVVTRVDLVITRELATKRAAYKGPKHQSN